MKNMAEGAVMNLLAALDGNVPPNIMNQQVLESKALRIALKKGYPAKNPYIVSSL
jgi:hypothetical protein